jgi:hypothetical protein
MGVHDLGAGGLPSPDRLGQLRGSQVRRPAVRAIPRPHRSEMALESAIRAARLVRIDSSVIAGQRAQTRGQLPGPGSAQVSGWRLSRGDGADESPAWPPQQLAAAVGAAAAQLASAGGTEGAFSVGLPGDLGAAAGRQGSQLGTG